MEHTELQTPHMAQVPVWNQAYEEDRATIDVSTAWRIEVPNTEKRHRFQQQPCSAFGRMTT
jgi:hypothetical protein